MQILVTKHAKEIVRMKYLISLSVLMAILLLPVGAIAQDLVLYYPFEGTGDTVVDQSGKGNDGEFDTGAANRVASKEQNLERRWNSMGDRVGGK